MRRINPAPGLVPYIIGAAVAAFALNYCIQSVEVGLNVPDRIGAQSDPALPVHIVDRSHKGDRLPADQRIYGQDATSSMAAGNLGLFSPTMPHIDLRPAPGPRPELPDGCESAFSPMSAAEQKTSAARCLT
jgi:hypothetical protein